MAHGRHAVSASRLDGADDNSTRSDAELRRFGGENRATEGGPSGGPRQRFEPDKRRRAVPPGYRNRWLPDGLRRRHRTQAMAAQSRRRSVQAEPSGCAVGCIPMRRQPVITLTPRARLGAPLWIFSAATALSITGTVIQKVAVGWSVWEATQTTTWLAAAAAADLLPTLILSIPAGALVDRFRPATTFWIGQAASCLQAVTLCILAASNHLTIGRLLACAVFIGICNAFTVPSRLAYMAQLTSPACFPRAVVLYSLGGNAAFFAGPMIASALIAVFGATAAYAANALAYLPMIAVAVTLPTDAEPPQIQARALNGVMGEMWAGLKYAALNRAILSVLLSFAAIALTARGIMELSPSIAATALGGGLRTLSLLMSSFAVGALAAGVVMARWAGWSERGMIATTLTGTAVAVIGYGASGHIAIALMSSVVLGFMVAANNISVNTAIQLYSEPHYRGRINSLYNMIFKGGPAISAAIFGWLANLTDIRFAGIAAAGTLILSMLWIVRQTTAVRVIGSALTKLGQSA